MHTLAQAANILDTSEYEVLLRAYADWYGAAAQPLVVQQAFALYLKDGRPPYWARLYVQKVVTEFERQQAATTTRVLCVLMGACPRWGRRRGGYRWVA